MLERQLRELAGDGFVVTCLRFATACGMSDRLRLDLVLNDFVACAVTTKRITVLSDGTPWRPLINVADMARAIEWALQRDANNSDCLVVNAGSDAWNYQVHELAAAVAQVIPGTEVSINRDAPPDKRSYRVDFSLFRRLAPLHQPQASLIDTIAGLRDGLAAMSFDDPDFRGSSLMRLRVLTDLRSRGLLNDTLHWADARLRRTASLGAEDPAISTTAATAS
jgi:nucleoside-diphosphate-sugar epimerase